MQKRKSGIVALKEEYYPENKKEKLSTDRFSKVPSRNDMMMEAKSKGIKYFRILNKEELGKVLDDSATPEGNQAIIDIAKARWEKSRNKKVNKFSEELETIAA